MGRMKEIYMQLMQANQGNLPEEVTIADMARMHELNIYNWEEYAREQEKVRLFRVKQENPREITKVIQAREFWEKELNKGEVRKLKEN
jgi:hypothetical protein